MAEAAQFYGPLRTSREKPQSTAVRQFGPIRRGSSAGHGQSVVRRIKWPVDIGNQPPTCLALRLPGETPRLPSGVLFPEMHVCRPALPSPWQRSLPVLARPALQNTYIVSAIERGRIGDVAMTQLAAKIGDPCKVAHLKPFHQSAQQASHVPDPMTQQRRRCHHGVCAGQEDI